MNYLLSSLPPKWQTSAVRLPVHAASVFDRLFIARPEVRRTVRALRVFLESNPEANLATRERREALLDTLLAPLYATSLAHAVHAQVQEDRFGEANKAARQARRERRMHDGVFHDYPGLAVQNMGGTKPQNISQLNSERRGVNYLLSSLPPNWQTSAVRLPVHAVSVFDRLFIARPEVRRTVRTLLVFLESNPDANLATRERREALLDTLVDELVSLAAELQQLLPPGWSRDDERFADLHRSEQLWLDPLRAEQPDEAEFAREWLQMDWPAAVGQRFANWLNAQLRGKLPLGDAEARAWQKELLTDEDGFQQQLRALRQRLNDTATEATP